MEAPRLARLQQVAVSPEVMPEPRQGGARRYRAALSNLVEDQSARASRKFTEPVSAKGQRVRIRAQQLNQKRCLDSWRQIFEGKWRRLAGFDSGFGKLGRAQRNQTADVKR